MCSSDLAASVTWAPLLGSQIAAPVTGMLNDGSVIEFTNPMLRAIRWCDRRGMRFLTRMLCFVEGVRYPRRPAHFVIGMRNSRPGSWLEKVFAREVYKFSNVANASKARDILRLRHDDDPGPHERVEVNLALLSDQRAERSEPAVLELPPAPPPPPLKRKPGIRLFEGADAPPASEPPGLA